MVIRMYLTVPQTEGISRQAKEFQDHEYYFYLRELLTGTMASILVTGRVANCWLCEKTYKLTLPKYTWLTVHLSFNVVNTIHLKCDLDSYLLVYQATVCWLVMRIRDSPDGPPLCTTTECMKRSAVCNTPDCITTKCTEYPPICNTSDWLH